MNRYNPGEIEPKWQKKWETTNLYQADDGSSKPKYYALSFFPYPSGVGLHIGHTRNFAITDVVSRYMRMKGYEVLHPMGWDSFGLPGENYAIKTGINPKITTKQNTDNFRRQCKRLGLGIDWSREFGSTDPEYYRWTQWFFLMLHKRDLAYRKESAQFWCGECKTVLANEQVVNGMCWRHETNPVTKKTLPQWFFKITEYADRLAEDLDQIDWPEGTKAMQRNWIGKKQGINITYRIDNAASKEDENVIVFTTRPDTNFGASFVVVAPEHPLAKRVAEGDLTPADGSSNAVDVTSYIAKSLAKTDIERQEEGRAKTGVFTGLYAHNPLTKERMPIWVSDFVLIGFGTGAVVGVPGHDLRDFQFAKTFGLDIKRVVVGKDNDTSEITNESQVQEDSGQMINSGFLDGLNIHDATLKMMDHMEEHGMGKRLVNYKIRDWLISRQRYWGAPIPIIHCDKCGAVPVPEDQLPVVLPDLEKFQPSGDGQSPLAQATNWVNVNCPSCYGPGKRETDTMDGFACSSWYFLRFADAHNAELPFDKAMADKWLPVDMYVGGAEHAVMHLLYARMWTKVMQDAGLIDFGEPFKALRNQGMLLAADGQKISKSKGNDIKPEDIIDQGYGADALRMITLFLAPYSQSTPWSNDGLAGVYRFLVRVWTLVGSYLDSNHQKTELVDKDLITARNVMIKRVTLDLDSLGFNTAISAMMECLNTYHVMAGRDANFGSSEWRESLMWLVQALAPFAPHIAEELFESLGGTDSVHQSAWPVYDESSTLASTKVVVVQVNGKLRGQFETSSDNKNEAELVAKAQEIAAKFLSGQTIKKTVVVKARLVNFVV